MEQDLHRLAFDASPDMLVVVDRSGRMFRVNHQVERLFGYAPEELIGEQIEVLVPERFRERHVLHRKRYASTPNSRPMGADLDLFALRKDGSEFPVDIMLSPLHLDDRVAVLCVVRDVTERRKAEENFRALLESAPDAMVIADEAGKIVLVNSQAEAVFGYPRVELLDRPIEMLIPKRYRPHHPAHRARYFSSPDFRPMGAGLELHGLRKDGTEFPVEISLSPLETEEGVLVSSAIRDITERKRAEQLIDSLREKEVMLKEIHHRVKNNLAVISSMFYLQSTYTTDEHTVQILRENQDRVRCMALVHESLYGSEDYARIEFAEYAGELCRMVLQSHATPSHTVRLHTRVPSLPMNIETAVPCGLILNELMTNALTHAFPNGRQGEIFVSLDKGPGGQCRLSVADTGIGVPDDVSVRETRSLGLRLVGALVKQLGGEFELTRNDPGTIASLTFSVETAPAPAADPGIPA